MYFWDLNIDTVTSIILIIALGLSIDFSAHIGHTFMTTKGNRTGKNGFNLLQLHIQKVGYS